MTAALFLVAGAFAADLNGKWTGETQTKKGSSTLVLDLKAEGDKLTGSLSRGRGGKGLAIKDGKIEGDSFRFTVTQQSKKGDREVEWKGTVEGDQMKLTPGGRRRAPTVTLKRG